MKRGDLPRSVFGKGLRYYLVTAEGKRRVWHKLSRIADGLPALYLALAAKKKELAQPALAGGMMPALIAEWELEVLPAYAARTQTAARYYDKGIGAAFALWPARKLDPPACAEFLKQFKAKPRTFNAYRSQLRELMRYAEERGLRAEGSNPIESLRTMRTRSRSRCPNTSELRRVKVGCLYGDDGRRTRSGLTMACLIELLYLTGQDVSVAIRLLEKRDPLDPDEPHASEEGIFFRRDKTGNAVVIGWTPRLRAVVDRLLAMKEERLLRKRADQRVVTSTLFTKQDGQPLTYEAVANAWQRGIKRAKVLPFMLRDIRAAAMTDKEEAEGMRAANTMGAHATESQTATYVRRKRARKTSATR